MHRLAILFLLMLLAGCGAVPTAPTAAPTAAAKPATPAAAPAPAAPAPVAPARDQVEVIEVIDGDTIKVRFGHGAVDTVRYIGIDTPETRDPRTTVECFGQEASTKNAELVRGRTVQLERDVSERDQYNRLLRYVWVTGNDGAERMANQGLVTWGFAVSSAYPPDAKYQDIFLGAEKEARSEKRGLWDMCSSPHQPLPAATPAAPMPAPPVPAQTSAKCDPSYPDVCIPPGPPDLDCPDIPHRNFRVRPPDPHRFDGDGDGIGCESARR